MRLRVGLSFKNRRPGFCWDGGGTVSKLGKTSLKFQIGDSSFIFK
jgi:hypothetical protein